MHLDIIRYVFISLFPEKMEMIFSYFVSDQIKSHVYCSGYFFLKCSIDDDVLLVQRQNTKKSFPRILERGKVKPDRLYHKTPPNMAPHNNETKIFKSQQKNT